MAGYPLKGERSHAPGGNLKSAGVSPGSKAVWKILWTWFLSTAVCVLEQRGPAVLYTESPVGSERYVGTERGRLVYLLTNYFPYIDDRKWLVRNPLCALALGDDRLRLGACASTNSV